MRLLLLGLSMVATNHGIDEMNEREGSNPGRRRRALRVERVAALALSCALASAALGSCAPGVARAQSSAGAAGSVSAPAGAAPVPGVIQRADAAFQEGRALFEVGRYEEACEKFELSMQLDPSPGTSLNLGNCYEPQGDLVRALENFERALADAQRTSDARRKALWTEAARERIASLAGRVPRLSLHNVPPDGRVAIDRRQVEGSNEGLRINPGRHRIEVSAPGRRTFRQDVDFAIGERVALHVPALEAGDAAAGGGAQVQNDVDPLHSQGTGGGTKFGALPYVLAGAGVALLATSVGTGLAAKAKQNELANECMGNICPPGLEGTRDGAQTLAAFTDAFWITGLVSAGVGLTLFVLDSQDDTASTRLEAGCFGSGCGLIAHGHL